MVKPPESVSFLRHYPATGNGVPDSILFASEDLRRNGMTISITYPSDKSTNTLYLTKDKVADLTEWLNSRKSEVKPEEPASS